MSARRAVTFVVPGPPVAKGRARVGRTRAGHVRMITPAETVQYEQRVRDAAWAAMLDTDTALRQPFLGPLRLVIEAVFARARQAATRQPKATRPDVDNVAKAISDALNGLVYEDDGQVVELVVRKWWAAAGEAPSVTVTVEELP